MSEENKKSSFKIFAVIAVVVIVLGIIYKFTIGTYNTIVDLDENVSSAWSQVENQYQRRLDLIPNLVNSVKAYAKHEESLFTQLAEARSKLGGVVNIDASITSDPQKFAEYQKIQGELSSGLQRLMAISENYPELKANQNFLALQDELAGTENRIATERKRFNDSAKTYNSYIRKFPQSIIAERKGFEKKAYFEADSTASKAPVVQF